MEEQLLACTEDFLSIIWFADNCIVGQCAPIFGVELVPSCNHRGVLETVCQVTAKYRETKPLEMHQHFELYTCWWLTGLVNSKASLSVHACKFLASEIQRTDPRFHEYFVGLVCLHTALMGLELLGNATSSAIDVLETIIDVDDELRCDS